MKWPRYPQNTTQKTKDIYVFMMGLKFYVATSPLFNLNKICNCSVFTCDSTRREDI